MRRIREGTVALGLWLCSGCDVAPSDPRPEPDRRVPGKWERLTADVTISDSEAIRRAVMLHPGSPWAKSRETTPADADAEQPGAESHHGPGAAAEVRVRGRIESGFSVDADASGAPALHLKWEPGVGLGSSTRVSTRGERWTIEQERNMDMTTFCLDALALQRVAQVGAPRRLRFMELTFLKTVGTAAGEVPIEIFRAVIPGERLGKFAEMSLVTEESMAGIWDVVFDRYDQLSVGTQDR